MTVASKAMPVPENGAAVVFNALTYNTIVMSRFDYIYKI